MAKKLNNTTYNVNLAFSADADRAKKQLQDLKSQLISIANTPIHVQLADTNAAQKIREASIAAAELTAHLNKATNVDTGKLDFAKLNESLKRSNISINEYMNTIKQMGPVGQKAFISIAQSIAESEVPLKRSNKLIDEMWNTLKNTARWQISSSILHGFMGALQSAYGYAQDLNESLNDIRIVTGQSVEQMADFAVEANKAAKALSTTTTEYTKASLIYYQQGLSDKEVKDRTDITVKMANAARSSAEKVSDQLTAVWNNFYDGSKSLEYYADVMTALGAATASSTDEISEGLNKFAATADTIGLSYEYAASALATVTATTRESADIVGTAFKTLFSRVQDLELGKTLDDGTTLGKYSEALKVAGVDIKDMSGNLKDMDTILEELGAKWNTLSKDVQVATAQTVAGTRQYTQLVALMDNWSFMQKNLATSYSSTGTLDEQADIYAESWEAARDRVTAAAEGIYDSLINDEFFIDLLNNVEKAITFVEKLVDGLGGMEGVLLSLSAILTKVFEQKLSQGLQNAAYSLKMATPKGRAKVAQEKQQVLDQALEDLPASTDYSSTVEKAAIESMKSQLTLQQAMLINADKMNEVELERNKMLLDRNRVMHEIVEKAAQEYQAAQEKVSNLADKIIEGSYEGLEEEEKSGVLRDVSKGMKGVRKVSAQSFAVSNLTEQFNNNLIDSKTIIQKLNKIKKAANIDIEINADNLDTSLKQISKALEKQKKNAQKEVNNLINTEITPKNATLAKELTDAMDESIAAQYKYNHARKESIKIEKTAQQAIDNSKGKQVEWTDILVQSANAIFNISSLLSMFGSLTDTLASPDVSGWQKFVTILSTLGMMLPILINLIGTSKKLLSSETIVKLGNVVATLAQVSAEKKLNNEKKKSTISTKENIKQTLKDTKEKISNNIQNKGKNIKDAWNQGALAKNKRFTQTKSGSYSVKGVQGFVSADKAAAMAGKEALIAAGGIGLIAIGIAAAAGAVAWGVAQYNKQEKAAEKAAKSAKKAADAYRAVADAYNQFTSNISAYEDAQKGLEGLTKGTLEYREAVLKANESALELLNTYSDLKYTTDENGLIVIDEESLKQEKEQQLNALQNAQTSKQLAQQAKENAELKNDITKFNRKELNSGGDFWTGLGNTTAAMGAGAGSGALIGAGLGLVGGPLAPLTSSIGAAVGAAIGATAGLVTGVSASIAGGSGVARETKALEQLQEVYAREGSAAFASDEFFRDLLENGLELKDEALINSLVKNRESTLELVTQMEQNSQAIQEMNEQTVKTHLSDAINQASGGDIQRADLLAKSLGANLDEVTEEQYKKEFKDKAGNLSDKEIQKMYAEAMGWDASRIKNLNKNKATYYDKAGNIVAEELDDDIARQFLAQQAALEKLSENIDQYVVTLNKVVAAGNHLGEGVGDAIATFTGGRRGTFENLNRSTMTSLSSEFIGPLSKDATSFTLGNQTFDATDAKSMGFDTLQELYETMQSEFIYSAEAMENLNISLMEYSGISKEIIDNFSLKTGQALEKQLTSLNLGPAGKESGKQFIDGINTMIADLDADKQQEALGRLMEIDWSSWDAMKQAKELMSEYGVEIDLSSNAWSKFTAEMRTAAGAIPDFSQLQTNLQNISKILQDLNFGSVIEDEDYKKLVSYNKAWEQFFIMQADGTRKFIGDSKTLKDSLKEETVDSRQKQLNRLDAQQRFLNTGLGEVDWSKENASSRYISMLAQANENTPAITNMLEALGYSPADVENMRRDQDKEGLQELIKRINNFKNENISSNILEMDQQIASLSNTYSELRANQYSISEDNRAEVIANQQKAIAIATYNSAESVNELINARKEAIRYGVEVQDVEGSYQQKLLELASAYEICTYEAWQYQEAIKNGDEFEIEAAETALEAAIKRASATEILKDSDVYDIYREYNEEVEKLDKNLEDLNEKSEGEIGEGIVSIFDDIETTLEDKQSKISAEIQKTKDSILKAREELMQGSKGFGLQLDIDEEGDIRNYDEYMSSLLAKRNQIAANKDKYAGTDQAAYWNDQFATIEKFIENVQKGVTNIDDLTNHSEELYESLEDTNKEVVENTINKFARAQENFEGYIDTLDSYKNLLELTGQEVNHTEIIEVLKGIQQVREDSYKSALEGFEALKATGNATEEEMKQAQDNVLAAVAEYASSLKATILEELEGLDKGLEKAMIGDMTFNELSENMERAQSLQEEYLTDTNKIYEVNKLINDAQKQIDATTNSVAKQKLKNFIDQTKELEKQNKLSKFELDIRKAEYDVMLAEIALQDAQQAKSTVRLRRDSEGNFGYVYTADENKVADAQQRLADAENALYNVGLEGANNYAQKQQQILQEGLDKMAEINRAYAEGEIATYAEYDRQMQAIRDYTLEQFENYGDLLDIAADLDANIMKESWANSVDIQMASTKKLKDAMDTYITDSSASIDTYKGSLETLTGESGAFAALGLSIEDIITESDNLTKSLTGDKGEGGTVAALNQTNEQANTTADEGVKKLEEEIKTTNEQVEKLTNLIEGNEDQAGLNTALEDSGKKADSVADGFNKLHKAIGYTSSAVATLDRTLSALSGKTFSVNYEVIQNVITKDVINKPQGKQSETVNKYDHIIVPATGTSGAMWEQFNTGGYTGEWGPNGKLAILDEKEIVLNQEDTANLLASVELLRGIINMLDLQTASSMLGGLLSSPGYAPFTGHDTIEQNVKIEASFPAVQDRNEIEEAFNNLINAASQYANRK